MRWVDRIPRKLWERQMNPVSWVLRPFFLLIYFYGLYIHSLLFIILGLFSLATGWLWFPAPKKLFAHTGELIDLETDYLRKPFRGLKALELIASLLVFIAASYALWHRDVITGFILVEVLLGYKLIWIIAIARRASWVPVVTISIAMAVFAAIGLSVYVAIYRMQFMQFFM